MATKLDIINRALGGPILLPCPFCGSTDIDAEGWASTDRSGPACMDCSGSADTVELWNKRPEVERLRAALAPFAAIPLWRDSYPDAKKDELAAQQMHGYVKVADVRQARAALEQQATEKSK